jgi:hypothetical protein
MNIPFLTSVPRAGRWRRRERRARRSGPVEAHQREQVLFRGDKPAHSRYRKARKAKITVDNASRFEYIHPQPYF